MHDLPHQSEIPNRTWNWSDYESSINYGENTLALTNGTDLFHTSVYEDGGRDDKRETHTTLAAWLREPTPPFVIPTNILDEVVAHAGLPALPVQSPQVAELFKGARTGDIAAIGHALAQGADAWTVDRLGLDPLYYALVHFQRKAAALLIAQGVNPTRTYRVPGGDQTLLELAVVGGDVDAVRSLVALGCDPRHLNAEGLSLLGRLRDPGSGELARILLGAGADPNAGCIKPLVNALSSCDRGTVDLLLERGADPRTPLALHFAAGICDTGTCRERLSKESWASLTRMDRELIGRGRIGGRYDDRPNLVRRLIAGGADVNATDPWFHETPLIWAARLRFPESVAVLLEAGADPRGVTPDGTTAIGEAGQRCVAAARMLLRAGAPVEGCDCNGKTVLEGAMWLKDAVWFAELRAAGGQLTDAARTAAKRARTPFELR